MAKMTPAEMADALADFVNGADKEDMNAFAQRMVNGVHRTLQQRVMTLFLKTIEEWGNLSPARYDLRNEATVKLCQRIINLFDKYDRSLPLI